MEIPKIKEDERLAMWRERLARAFNLDYKMQRTLMLQFEAIGLNYKTTPSKVKEDTKKGVDSEKDGLSSLLTQARDTMNEIPEL